jgi:TetR/AcrR family transcriptional regulator, transcriptional repressor of bet genes
MIESEGVEVPKLSNHEQRRAHILDALLRIASSSGLQVASMRTVAAEAGVTVSTVQYYFHSKEQLLFAGLQRLAEAVSQRAAAEVRSTALLSIRDTLQAWLIQMIPVDDDQRASYTVFAAYHALALTDPALAQLPYTRNSGALETAIGDQIRTAQRDGEVPPDRDAQAEAANLLALATGLGDSVMANMRKPEAAIDLLRYHLDHLFRTD